MRTFPRELATFRDIVSARGDTLRKLSYEAIQERARGPLEHLEVGSRPATIGIIVQPAGDGRIRVVLQGFVSHRLLPGKSVALDGFYKHRDGSVAPMPDDELDAFD